MRPDITVEQCDEFFQNIVSQLKVSVSRWRGKSLECMNETFGFTLDQCGVSISASPDTNRGGGCIRISSYFYLTNPELRIRCYHGSFAPDSDNAVAHCQDICDKFPFLQEVSSFEYNLLTQTPNRENFDLLLQKIIRNKLYCPLELQVLKYFGQPRYSMEQMEQMIERLVSNLKIAKQFT